VFGTKIQPDLHEPDPSASPTNNGNPWPASPLQVETNLNCDHGIQMFAADGYKMTISLFIVNRSPLDFCTKMIDLSQVVSC
jgi:hypothetical protein